MNKINSNLDENLNIQTFIVYGIEKFIAIILSNVKSPINSIVEKVLYKASEKIMK